MLCTGTRQLDGMRVLVTRSREQAPALSDLLRESGAIPLLLPAIEIQPVDTDDVGKMLRNISEYDWLVLTSSNSARMLARQMEIHGLELQESIARCSVAAVGAATASAFRELGGRVDLIPKISTGEALAAAMLAQGPPERVIVPGSRIARLDLSQLLRGAGVEVTPVVIYDTVCPREAPAEVSADLEAGRVDVITFTSPSSVINTCQLVGSELLRQCSIVTIGPSTSKEVKAQGLEVHEEARESSVQGLVEAVKCVAARRVKGE